MRALDVENPVWSTLSKVVDIIVLNLLFVLFCIPIITIGPSATALSYTAMRLQSGNITYVWRDFWNSFKQNFKQAFVVEWIVFDIAVILAVFTYLMSDSYVGHVVFLVLDVLYAAVVTYIFPSLAKFEMDTQTLLRNSCLMAVAHFPYTILNVVIWGAIAFCAYFYSLYMIVIFGLFGFASVVLVQSIWFNRIFAKYMSAEELEQNQIYREEERYAKAEKKRADSRDAR